MPSHDGTPPAKLAGSPRDLNETMNEIDVAPWDG
jgi:hypothetical protein